jgi:hypothetical protein
MYGGTQTRRGPGRKPSDPAPRGRPTSALRGRSGGAAMTSLQAEAGAAQPLNRQERTRSAEPPDKGDGGWQESAARAKRSGAGVFLLEPLEGRRGKARRSVRSSALPSRRGAGSSRLAAQRSAGGCADRCTLVTTRARALSGPDAAEASPRRCASWRSRGRWWRGPSARATERPCRLGAV